MKSAIQAKYDRLRHFVDTGDIIPIRGKGILSKGILWADKANYSHALVSYGTHGNRLEAIESLGHGVTPNFLSLDIEKAEDFCIIKPKFSQEWKDKCFDKYFKQASKGIPYDWSELLRILLVKKFGAKIKNIQGNPHEAICSVSAGYLYGHLLPLKCYEEAYKKQGYLSPQDLIRFADPKEVTIIGNDYI